MGFLVLLGLPILFPYITPLVEDPAPGLFHSKADARRLDCTFVGADPLRAAEPGVIHSAPTQLNLAETRSMPCRTRLMEHNERLPRDEAILSELTPMSAELAEAASALGPGKRRTWLVEAFHPDAAITAKIVFATKTELVSRGHIVSDKVPMLAAGDILVLATLPPEEAYPLACRRYYDHGALTDDDVLMGVMLLDTRETLLHAGLCSQGAWMWLR